MKAREYAISLGLAKAGRGKLSKDAHAAIQLAIETGQVFEDYKDGRVVKNDNGSNRNNNHGGIRGVHAGNGDDSNSGSHGGQDERARETEEIKSNPVTHDYSVVYGIDVMRLSRPVVIAFEYCSKCLLQVKYCLHDIPQLPEYLGGGDGSVTYPTTEEMADAVKKANELKVN
jgi:hypothetical protein